MTRSSFFLAVALSTAVAAPGLAQTPAPGKTGTKQTAPAPIRMTDGKPDQKPDPGKALADIKAGLQSLDDKKYPDAIKAFNEAYNLGNGDGAFYIARMVELGVGLKADFDKAHALYLAAASKDSAKAMNRLGLMAYRGEHVLQDYKAASELICKAADKGDADAQFNCAGLYADGKGEPKDIAKAIAYYQKAADQGHIGALNALAFAYRDGIGVTADLVKAQGYYEKAAAKGNPIALYELGAMYEKGKPMPRDLSKAHLYYNLASARQHPAAEAALQRVSALMTPAQIEKAQEAARAWKAVP